MDVQSWINFGIVAAACAGACVLILLIMRKIFQHKRNRLGDAINDKFLQKFLEALVILAAVLIALYQISSLRSLWSTLLASSGIVALAISLAAQESLANIVDGIFISVFKPFNIGDRITLPEKNNLTGIVQNINLRHTVITTYANTSYIISNSTLSSAIVENSSFNDCFAYPIDVSISYDSDLKLAMKLLEQAVTTHPDFVDRRSPEDKAAGKPKSVVLVRDFGDSGIALRCQMVVADVNKSFVACSEVRIAVKELFDANGIVIPYTTITIAPNT